MDWALYTLIASGGALGCVCRFGLSTVCAQLLGTAWPYGTVLVNLLGCLLLGYVGQEGFPFSELSPRLRMAVGIGFLGGLTTFSTFGYELWQQLELGHRMAAGLYLSCSVLLGLCATWLGATLARW